MIFTDLETTGLLRPSASELATQPYITELYAVKLTEDYQFVEEIDTFVKPPIPIPEEITKITGITNSMVSSAPTFVSLYDKLVNFYLGEREVIAHNCSFDMGVMYCELARIGKEFQFPWCPKWTCTVEKSIHLEHHRLTLSRLHELATGAPHQDAHRAKFDVYALVICHMWLRKNGIL